MFSNVVVRKEAARPAGAPKRDMAREVAAARALMASGKPVRDEVIDRVADGIARDIAPEPPVIESRTERRSTNV